MSGTEKLQFNHADSLYSKLRLRAEKMFCMKMLLILPSFMKFLSSGNINSYKHFLYTKIFVHPLVLIRLSNK